MDARVKPAYDAEYVEALCARLLGRRSRLHVVTGLDPVTHALRIALLVKIEGCAG
jgi:hypothetical protein